MLKQMYRLFIFRLIYYNNSRCSIMHFCSRALADWIQINLRNVQMFITVQCQCKIYSTTINLSMLPVMSVLYVLEPSQRQAYVARGTYLPDGTMGWTRKNSSRECLGISMASIRLWTFGLDGTGRLDDGSHAKLSSFLDGKYRLSITDTLDIHALNKVIKRDCLHILTASTCIGVLVP